MCGGPLCLDCREALGRAQPAPDQGIYPLEEVSGNVRERLSNAKFGEELQRNLDYLSDGVEIVFFEENIAKVSIGASRGEAKRTGHGGH